MTGRIECRYYGRDFSAEEMALLRALIAGPPPLNRHALSKEFCRRIGWFKPDGGLKDMMARVTMLAMHRDGLIVLPPPRGRQNRPRPIASLGRTPKRRCSRPRQRSTRSARSICGPSCARLPRASSGTSSSPATTILDTRPWSAPRCAMPSMTETAGRSPCSASAPPRGSSHRATALSDGCRDCARRTSPLVVDNPRFLILPWIEIPNLGSHILAIVRRRLPDDWTERYNTNERLN